MRPQRIGPAVSKARLSWCITRLCLEADGHYWRATASKGGRIAVARLPELTSTEDEPAWLARIEAEFERNAKDPIDESYQPTPLRLDRAEGEE